MIKKVKLMLIIPAILIASIMKSQTLPNMGTATDYAILSGTEFFATDTVVAKGTVGSVSGNLNIIKADAKISSGTILTTALNDLASAKNSLLAQGGSVISNTLTGQVLSAGVYSITGNAILNDTLRLTGDTNSIFIFNINGDLALDNAILVFDNQIRTSKIFWNVTGKINFNTNTQMAGLFLASGHIKVYGVYSGFCGLLSPDSLSIFNTGASTYESNMNSGLSRYYSQNQVAKVTNIYPDNDPNCSNITSNCNLITNPSFEVLRPVGSVTYCPDDDNQIDRACNWNKYYSPFGGIKSPIAPNNLPTRVDMGDMVNTHAELFSSCNGGDWGVPYNKYCYAGVTNTLQSARTGNNYAGFEYSKTYGTIYCPFAGTSESPLYTGAVINDEKIEKYLGFNLTPNQTYYMEFYTSLAPASNATTKIGVYPLYNGTDPTNPVIYFDCHYDSPNPQPFFHSASNITYNANWTKVSGCVTTTSANVGYLSIRAFTDDGITGITPIDPNVPAYDPSTFKAYFFVDDVLLKPLADAATDKTVTCSNTTTIGATTCSVITGATYSWTAANGFTSSNSTITSATSMSTNVTFSNIGTFVYNLTVTFNGCSATDQVTVTVNSLAAPQLTVTGATTICAGNSATLTASGATSYTWMPGSITTATAVLSPTATTIYTVSGTTSVSCAPGTKTVQVTVTAGPSVSITNTTTTICNSVASFTAVATPSTGITYSWAVKDVATGTVVTAATITGSTTAISTIDFTNVNQNVYVVCTVTNSLGCTATKSVTLLSCCFHEPGKPLYSNTTFTTNTSIGTTKILMGGTLTVVSGASLTISATEVTFDPYTKIIVNSGGYLKITRSYLHGCNAMWHGIMAVGNATVIVEESRIYDGITSVVDSTGGATIALGYNWFNKNHTSVLIKGTKSSTSSFLAISNLFTSSQLPAPSGLVFLPPVTANLTNAATLGAYTVDNLMPPYQTKKPYAGIQFMNTLQTGATNSMIPVGSATSGTENVFDKINMGVLVYRSNALIQNNVFQNINIATVNGTNNSGVYVYGRTGSCFSCITFSTQIGGSSSLKNTFTNCDYGVYSALKSALTVSNNSLTTQGTGIYVQDNSANYGGSGFNDVTINQNKIYKADKGVVFTNNKRLNATISDNRIDNTTGATGSYSTNVGITIAEATAPTGTLSSYAKYTVYNNYIKDCYNGIYSTNTYSAQISDNEVHMLPDNAAWHTQMGINAGGNRYVNIFNNTIDMPSYTSGSWGWQYGIMIDQTQIPYINCNIIDKVPVSIKMQGPCNTTTMTNEFVNNKLSNAFVGIWQHTGDFNGNQAYWVGSTPYAGDNTFTNVSNKTYCSNFANTSNSKIYTRTGTLYQILLAEAVVDGSGIPQQPLFGTNNSTANVSNTCATQINTSARMGNTGVKLFNKTTEIANGSLNSNGYNAANFKYLNNRYLMEHILMQDADVSNDNLVTSFMNTMRHDNIGGFYAVDSLLQLASLNDSTTVYASQAQASNSIINPNNTIEYNQKRFNNLYLNYLSNNLSNGDLQQLRHLASKCPYIDGHAVFQARAILNQFDNNLYYDDCPKDNSTTKRMGNMDEGNIANANIVVYPNPANNEINVSIVTDEYQKATITIYNLIGELITTQSLINGINNINIINLKSGTYLYSIGINDTPQKNGKLIIMK